MYLYLLIPVQTTQNKAFHIYFPAHFPKIVEYLWDNFDCQVYPAKVLTSEKAENSFECIWFGSAFACSGTFWFPDLI